MKNRLFIIRVASIIVVAAGLIMLISGILLHAANSEQRSAADGAQMPEEYIEKYFSDEGQEHNIEDYIEPEYNSENAD